MLAEKKNEYQHLEQGQKPNNRQKQNESQLALSAQTNTITELEPVSSGKDAFLLYFDHIPWATVSYRVVKDLRVEVGRAYQPNRLSERIFEEEKRLGMELALRLFSYRCRSEYEVTDKLSRKRLSGEAIEWVVRKLHDAGYLNDGDFVRTWISDRMDLRGYGRQRIRSELISKGIEIERINDELDNLYPLTKELKTAIALIKVRLTRYSGLDEIVVRRRLTQFLLRRGFCASTAQTVMRELLATSAN